MIFDPQTDGVVSTFTIASVGPEEQFNGKTSKTVTVTAPVKLPNGQTVDKKLVIAMERRGEGWMITGVAASPLK